MMRKNILFFVTLTLLARSATPVHAAGIPVIDVVGNTQRIAEFVATLEDWRQKYVYWTEELNKAQRLHDALNGVRNLGDVFDSAALRSYLPREFTRMYRALKKSGYDGLVRNGGVIWAANQIFERCDDILLDDARLQCETRAATPSQDSSDAEELYLATIERGIQIRELQMEINKTRDAGDRAALALRMDAENLSITNATNGMLATMMTQDAEKRVVEQRGREIAARELALTRGASMDMEPLTFDQ